jgi:phosphohistidine phosphatase
LKTLYILRHGQAVGEHQASTDHDRELTARGERSASQVGEQLKDLGKLPTLVLASTATRARRTAELCIGALGRATRLELISELYLAEPQTYLEELSARGTGHHVVLMVGHNPGLEVLANMLTQRTEHLATAALLEVELPVTDWSELVANRRGAGRLIRTWQP